MNDFILVSFKYLLFVYTQYSNWMVNLYFSSMPNLNQISYSKYPELSNLYQF
jgi:hypothetical protein